MSDILIGSARHDECGHYNGGAEGDQLQLEGQGYDFSGEVSVQKFYVHSKGWYVLRAYKKEIALNIRKSMLRACCNKKIGYNQDERTQIFKYGTNSNVFCNCDCSSLVRQCLIEAGVDVETFTTYNEKSKIIKTGKFDCFEYKKGIQLQEGDVLVTKSKGHTVVVLDVPAAVVVSDDRIDDLARRVIKGEFGYGATRRQRLEAIQVGMYGKVQKRVNELMNS